MKKIFSLLLVMVSLTGFSQAIYRPVSAVDSSLKVPVNIGGTVRTMYPYDLSNMRVHKGDSSIGYTTINKHRNDSATLAAAAKNASNIATGTLPDAQLSSKAKSKPADYIIEKIGSTYYANTYKAGLSDYSGTDAYTVIQATINALRTPTSRGKGGGKIIINADSLSLTDELLISGWENQGLSFPGYSQIVIEGKGKGTYIYQSTAGKNGIVIKNNASVSIIGLRIECASAARSAIRFDGSGTDPISCFGGYFEDLYLQAASSSYPALYVENNFDLHFNHIEAENSNYNAIILNNNSSTVLYGNSTYSDIRAIAKTTYPYAGLKMTATNGAGFIVQDLNSFNNYKCVQGYSGIYIIDGSNNTFTGTDVEYGQVAVRLDNGTFARSNYFFGGILHADSACIVTSKGGNVFNLDLGGTWTGTIPIRDFQNFEPPNKYDVGLSFTLNPALISLTNSAATRTTLIYRDVETARTYTSFGQNVTINSPTITTPTGIVKGDVGLGNVPNVDATNAANISTGTLPDARLSTNVTAQGNSFNGVSQLVKTDGTGKLPAIDGSQLTNVLGVWDVLSVKSDYSAATNGTTDAATAFQNGVTAAQTNAYNTLFVPMAKKERYLINTKINITQGNFLLQGNSALTNQRASLAVNAQSGPPLAGYITSSNTAIGAILDYGNNLADASMKTGAFTMKGLAFYVPDLGVAGSAGQPYAALKISHDNNGPSRAITITGNSFSGFQSAIWIKSPTSTNVVAADMHIRNNHFDGNGNAIYAEGQVFGMDFKDNVAEEGASIKGWFDGPVNIENNQLESLYNGIDITAPSGLGGNTQLVVRGNYLGEGSTGDFLVHSLGKSHTSSITVGPQISWGAATTTDIIQSDGWNAVILDQNINIPEAWSGSTGNRRSIVTVMPNLEPTGAFTQGILLPGTKLGGRNYYTAPITAALDNSTSAWLDPVEYSKAPIPSGAVYTNQIGSATLVTPFGRTTTGKNITGYSSANDITLSGLTYAIGDYVNINILMKWNNPQDNQTITIYGLNQSAAAFMRAGQYNYKKSMGDGWYLYTVTASATVAGTEVRVRVSPNGSSAGPTTGTIDVAAIGAYVTPAGDIDVFNSANRYLVRPFNPFVLPYGLVTTNSSTLGRVVLSSDQTNNNGTANTIQDVSGLSFAVTAGNTYKFRFVIFYSSAATTTGSRWSVSGPASPTALGYWSAYSLTATTVTNNEGLASYDLPAASNATSASTSAVNRAVIEGIITPSVDGTVTARFASEVASSAVVAKAGLSYVEYQQIN